MTTLELSQRQDSANNFDFFSVGHRRRRRARAGLLILLTLATALAASGCTTLDTSARSADGKIAYFRAGTGTPTVVFQSGLGDGKSVWAPVLRALSSDVSVLAYDRPGYGDSPATANPRDACSIAREQKAMLTDAAIAPPYLLVGHSLGGLYQYTYARLYPHDVAGLLLLDPTHPEHWQRMQVEAPATAAVLRAVSHLFIGAMRDEFNAQAGCMETLAQTPVSAAPSRLLLRSQFQLIEKGSFENMMLRLAEDWQRLIGAATIETIPNAGHYIQKDRPDVVQRAIVEMLPRR